MVYNPYRCIYKVQGILKVSPPSVIGILQFIHFYSHILQQILHFFIFARRVGQILKVDDIADALFKVISDRKLFIDGEL